MKTDYERRVMATRCTPTDLLLGEVLRGQPWHPQTIYDWLGRPITAGECGFVDVKYNELERRFIASHGLTPTELLFNPNYRYEPFWTPMRDQSSLVAELNEALTKAWNESIERPCGFFIPPPAPEFNARQWLFSRERYQK